MWFKPLGYGEMITLGSYSLQYMFITDLSNPPLESGMKTNFKSFLLHKDAPDLETFQRIRRAP